MKYRVYYSGYYGYGIDVEANNKEEAEEKANEIFDTVKVEDYNFEPGDIDIWKIKGV